MNFLNPQVEICTYSLFSVQVAERAGANRVELCSSPWDGGTTPSGGMVKAALSETTIEIHAMLRPRGGDFCYNYSEKETIKYELDQLLEAGVHGIVFGALLPSGEPDISFLQEIKNRVGAISLACHRAIDVARNSLDMLDVLIQIGFQRILSSGEKNKAIDGLENLKQMVEKSKNRIEIMAGSGVNSENCLEFIKIGCHAVHFSAKKTIHGQMDYKKPGISMGGIDGISEYDVFFASEEEIRRVVEIVGS